MPYRIFGELNIEYAQRRLARDHHLSRQEALMLALLVKYPTVTPDIIRKTVGVTSNYSLVSRLRRKLNDDLPVHTEHGFGFYLDAPVRSRLARPLLTVPRPVDKEARA